ncbi:MAG: hypothetical protein AB1420_02825 [Bacillota bacterium]
MVTLQLTSGMISYTKENKGLLKIKIGQEISLEELLHKANIDLREVGLVLKGEQKVEMADTVKDGEHLTILPQLWGG